MGVSCGTQKRDLNYKFEMQLHPNNVFITAWPKFCQIKWHKNM